jgi:molybdenum cofactor cytidylyltransferase
MGSPKALLPYRGETFLNRLIWIFSDKCDSVTVVLGYHAEVIRASIQHPVNVVINPEPERGQLSSMHTALSTMLEADRLIYTPVDYPAVAPETVGRLLDEPCESFVIPRYEEKRGHPIVCSWAITREFLNASTTARDVVHRHVDTTRYIDVDDPGILRDIDDPAAYAELLAAEAR